MITATVFFYFYAVFSIFGVILFLPSFPSHLASCLPTSLSFQLSSYVVYLHQINPILIFHANDVESYQNVPLEEKEKKMIFFRSEVIRSLLSLGNEFLCFSFDQPLHRFVSKSCILEKKNVFSF